MPSRHQIRCITKSNSSEAHKRITHIGGRNDNGEQWKLTEQEAIAGIESGKWTFFVSVGGNATNVIIASRDGKKYLKTVADGEQPNNLLSLPTCT